MAKMVEFDLSGMSDEEFVQDDSPNFAEQPKPGVYTFLIKEIIPGYTQGDKSRPRLEVVLDVVADGKGETESLKTSGKEGGDCTGARIWDYVSFSDASEWKQKQFFKAIGEASPKKKKGKFNAEKHEGKTRFLAVVKADSNQEGDYRAKIGTIFPIGEDAATVEMDDGLEDELEKDELEPEEPESEELEEDEDDDWDDEEEEEDELTEEQIRAMNPAQLKELAKEHGISLKGLKKAAAIDKLVEELVEDDVPF